MIVEKLKSLYIHVPRTGGSSIENFFVNNVDKEIEKTLVGKDGFGFIPEYRTHIQHLTVDEHIKHDILTVEEMKQYYKFCFVRNPWDLVLSEWSKHQRHLFEFDQYIYMMPKMFGSRFSTPGPSYDRFVFIRPQVQYIDNDHGIEMDFIGKFENLADDFKVVCDSLSLKKSTLPHINAQTIRDKHNIPYQDVYNHFKGTKEIIAEYYKEDIERFGYEF